MPLHPTSADFPCCALLMSRACCHHYPGGITGCMSRSLRRRRRPSPFVWRVGSHIDAFEACSVFTHVAARTVRWPPFGAFSRSASDHSSPPDPPRVLPAGARVCRPGFPPGRAVHLAKAHTPTPWSVPSGGSASGEASRSRASPPVDRKDTLDGLCARSSPVGLFLRSGTLLTLSTLCEGAAMPGACASIVSSVSPGPGADASGDGDARRLMPGAPRGPG